MKRPWKAHITYHTTRPVPQDITVEKHYSTKERAVAGAGKTIEKLTRRGFTIRRAFVEDTRAGPS